MRKVILITAGLCLVASGALAQIERGDSEVSFLGYFSTMVGEDVEPNGSGSFQLSYGKYVSRYLLFGVAPTLRFFTTQDEHGESVVETDWSGSIFFNFNFTTASKMVPYITGQYYQFTFDIPEGMDFTDFSYVNVGFGVKNFFNEYAALNMLGSYGFSLAEEAEGGIVVLMAGLSFIF